jgi:hypothetical protein
MPVKERRDMPNNKKPRCGKDTTSRNSDGAKRMTRSELTMEQAEFIDKCLKFLHTIERRKINAVHFEEETKACSKE